MHGGLRHGDFVNEGGLVAADGVQATLMGAGDCRPLSANRLGSPVGSGRPSDWHRQKLILATSTEHGDQSF